MTELTREQRSEVETSLRNDGCAAHKILGELDLKDRLASIKALEKSNPDFHMRLAAAGVPYPEGGLNVPVILSITEDTKDGAKTVYSDLAGGLATPYKAPRQCSEK